MRYFSGYSGCQKYVPFGVSQTKAVALTLSATRTYDNRYIIFFRKNDERLQTMGPVLFYGTAWLHCPSAACSHRGAQACLPGVRVIGWRLACVYGPESMTARL
jgi:hypothetical protein